MSREETEETKKKTVSKPKLTAKKKSASPESGTPKKKKASPESETPKKKKAAPESETPKKKKAAPESETPKKKKASPEAETPKKKKASPEAETPKKKKASPESEAPKKKKSSPESETPRKKKASPESETPKKKKAAPEPEPIKKKKAPASEDSAPKIKKVSSGSQVPEKKKTKVRLKRNAKIALAALCVGIVCCGAFAFKNASRSSAETEENLAEVETTEPTIPETTEEPTTEETTEEPTTENLNEPFIDYDYPVDPDKPMLALTYDDGPASSTSQILDILEENHAHATFFVVGENVDEDSEEILRREVALGCEVANHSWNHESLRDCDLEDALESLEKCDEAIFNAIHRYPQHVRPPYGEYSDELLEADGREFVYWSLDTNDWKYRNAKKDYEVLMDNLDDGDIILMHDIHPESADASEKIIPDLIEMGYQLVTVSELMYYRNCPHKPGMLLFDVHPDAPYYIWQGEYYDEPVEQDASEEDNTDEEEDASGDADSENDDSTEENTETSSSDDEDENDNDES